MRKYLSSLKRRPDHHKKRFALLASGTVTLFIFGFWSLATFGISDELSSGDNISASAIESIEVSPLESVKLSITQSIWALADSFKELREGTFETYGE